MKRKQPAAKPAAQEDAFERLLRGFGNAHFDCGAWVGDASDESYDSLVGRVDEIGLQVTAMFRDAERELLTLSQLARVALQLLNLQERHKWNLAPAMVANLEHMRSLLCDQEVAP